MASRRDRIYLQEYKGESEEMKTAHWEQYNKIGLLIEKKRQLGETVSVVIPTLNEEKCIATILQHIQTTLMGENGLVDEIIVMDGGSTDATVSLVEKCSVSCFDARVGEGGSNWSNGKGLALWRAQYIARGSIICYIDADIENFDERFVVGLVGALLSSSKYGFAKAYYTRPIRTGESYTNHGGGRVTELLVRPLLSRFYPEAGAIIQPLSGEYAFRTTFLNTLRFSTSYAVETVLLLEYLKRYNSETIMQVDMGERYHQNQPLENLGRMSSAILGHFAQLAVESGIWATTGEDSYVHYVENKMVIDAVEQQILPPVLEVK